jgi:aminoglycoside phosphotransferase (APT) family kinase protein
MMTATPGDLLRETPLRQELVLAVRPHVSAEDDLVRIGGYLDRSVVFDCGDTVLKCFFRAAESKWLREVRAYTFLADSGLPVPRVIASGRLSAQVPWLLMSRMPGELGLDALERMTGEDRVDIFRAAGSLLARLHSLAVDARLTGLAAPDATEAYFQRLQRRLADHGDRSARTVHHRAQSLARARAWTTDLLRFVPDELVCTHGDFSMRNLLVRERPGGWEISGLIDFELCEYGDAAIDLARMLVACRDWTGSPFRGFLEAYASHSPLPSRERILLQLGAIVLDAATWAEEKDIHYYNSLLDLVDHIDEHPHALPASFRSS